MTVSNMDWPGWFQVAAAAVTAFFAWRLNGVTVRQAIIGEEQNAIVRQQLKLEEQRDSIERARLSSLAIWQARALANRLATIGRDLQSSIEVGMSQDFYSSKGSSCQEELKELHRLYEVLATRDGKPTAEIDIAIEEFVMTINCLLKIDSDWERLQAEQAGNRRKILTFDASMHLGYAIVHLCRSVTPPLSIPHGIPPQTAR